MRDRAFIFTMDAVLALIPIFIVTASVSQISGGFGTLMYGRILGTERIANDVLEVMIANRTIEEVNRTKINNSLEKLIPSYLDYTYELEFNGTIVRNISRGNISNAQDLSVAKRLVLIKLYALLGIVAEVSHGGSPVTSEECPRSGQSPPIYKTTFVVASGDFDVFDYWIDGSASQKGVTAWYQIQNSTLSCNSLQSGGNWEQFMSANDYSVKFQLSESQVDQNHLFETATNYLYIRISANPNREGNFYIIKAPEDTASGLISYGNAIKRDFSWVTLKVSQR